MSSESWLMILVGVALLVLGFVVGLGWGLWLERQKRWWWRYGNPNRPMEVTWTRGLEPPNESWHFVWPVDYNPSGD